MTPTPRPLLFKRVPPRMRTALAWAAAALYVLAMPIVVGSGGDFNSVYSIFPALLMALLIGLLHRRPLLATGLLIAGFALTAFLMGTSMSARICEFLVITAAVLVVAASRPRRISLTAAAMAALVPVVHFYTPVRTGIPYVSTQLYDPSLVSLPYPKYPWRPEWAVKQVPPRASPMVEYDIDHLMTIAGVIMIITIAWLVGDAVRQRRRHAEALRTQATVQAVTAERLRIARELHDMVAHSIGIIAIQSGVGSRVIDTQPAEARNALTAIEATSRETLAGLRRMLVALRQADGDPSAQTAPLDPAPGLADVERLAATTAKAGVKVDVAWRGERWPLPQDIDLSAFRIIQEALTNVVRHAGTRHCRVSIEQRDEELGIEIVDDGRGAAAGFAEGGGFGLVGMRERVGLLHGRFEAGPGAGGGFRVAATLPVSGPALVPVLDGAR